MAAELRGSRSARYREARERHLKCFGGGILRIALDSDFFELTIRIVVYNHLERMNQLWRRGHGGSGRHAGSARASRPPLPLPHSSARRRFGRKSANGPRGKVAPVKAGESGHAGSSQGLKRFSIRSCNNLHLGGHGKCMN